MAADEHEHHENHGNSIAAWTAVVIVTLAFVIGSFAVMTATVWLFWACIGLCAVGVLAGKVLALMGFGVHADDASSADVA